LSFKWLFTTSHSLNGILEGLARNPYGLILLARGCSALIGTATVYAVYRLAKLLFNESAALLGALFLSLAYSHVRESHFVTTDVPLAFMCCLALYAITKVYRRGKIWDYRWAGFLTGLAASTKYPGILLIAPLVVAHATGRFAKHTEKTALSLGTALFWTLAGFLVGTPYALLSWGEFILQVQQDLSFNNLPYASMTSMEFAGVGWIRHMEFTLWQGLGWSLFLAALLGIFEAFRKHAKESLILFSFLFVYYAIMGKTGRPYVRHLLPLVPVLCIFAGYFIQDLFLFRLKSSRLFLALVSLLVVAPSLTNIYWFDTKLTLRDSRMDVADWVNRNIPKDRTLGIVGGIYEDPPIHMQNSIWRRWDRFKWPLPFLLKKPFSLPEAYSIKRTDLKSWVPAKRPDLANVEYVLLNQSYSLTEEAVKLMKKYYKLVASFEGVGNDSRMKFDRYDVFYLPFVGLAYAKRPGPNYYIFKIKDLPEPAHSNPTAVVQTA
jgi:hypothetical protein